MPKDDQLASLNPPYFSLTNTYFIRQDGPVLRVFVLDGVAASTPVECAQACTENEQCEFVTWHGADPRWQNNVTCWLKAMNRAAGYDCADIVQASFRPGSYLIARQTEECARSPSLARCER